jgi:hypothetical protein
MFGPILQGYPKHKQKKFKIAQQQFGTQKHFESKSILIQWLDEKD